MHTSSLSLQQLLKMREDLKQREAELAKSLEDKQQLNNQVQNLKEGLQNLQSTHIMQVSLQESILLSAGFPEEGDRKTLHSVSFVRFRKVHFCAALFGREDDLICTLIRKK